MSHGPFEAIFPDLFRVEGQFELLRGVRIGRNMIVVREGSDLTLINAVRLTPEGEAELEALGTVRHLVKIGAFHDADDA